MDVRRNAALEREKLRKLRGRNRFLYIWDYYKLPLAAACLLLYIAGYILYGRMTHRDTVLYVALVNVSAGDALTEQLGEGFLDDLQEDLSEKNVQLYTGLYLTDDEDNPYHEYTYASRMKILAAIDGEQLDVVLMNREAFDAFSQNGYLCDLKELFKDRELYPEIEPYLAENTVILEDNAAEVRLDPDLEYQSVTEERAMGLEISGCGLISAARFDGAVYLGILQNSPRKETAEAYIRFLSGI